MKALHPKNLIIRMPNWVGDFIMATPVLSALRKAFPEAKITAMCKLPLSSLLEKDPRIDELFHFQKAVNLFIRRKSRRDIISKLEMGKYDTALLLTNSFSSAWWFWQANIPNRIGYSIHFRKWLLTHPIKIPKSVHHIDRYKKLVSAFGIDAVSERPLIYIEEKEKTEALTLLKQRGYVEGKKLIGINPLSAYGPAKCWPKERFREVARELIQKEKDLFVVFFGDSTSFLVVKEICETLPDQVINLSGLTTLRELASLISLCDLFITNDSGPMHIACAIETPVIAIFGSTDPSATGPYGKNVKVLYKKASCSPCGKRECPIDFRCMREISVEEVVKAAQKKLH